MKKLILIFLLLISPGVLFAGTAEDVAAMKAGEWYLVNTPLSAILAGDEGNPYADSGGAFDTAGNRLLVWGGGHADGTGNGIFGWDLDTFSWTTIVASSDSAMRSAAYVCTDVTGPYAPNCSTGYLPDGKPVARHTYTAITYNPGMNAFQSLAAGVYATTAFPLWLVSTAYTSGTKTSFNGNGYRCILSHTSTLNNKPATGVNWVTYWELYPDCYQDSERLNYDYFNLTTNTWVIDQPNKSSVSTSEYGTALVDSHNNTWFFETLSYPKNKVLELKYSDSTWYVRGSNSYCYTQGYGGGAIDTDRNIAVIISNGYIAIWDLSNEAAPVLLSTSVTGETALTSANSVGLTWDAATGLFIGWSGITGATADVYALKVDPDNSFYHVWKIRPASTNTVLPPVRSLVGQYGPKGRWAYSPANNLAVLNYSKDTGVYLYKVSTAITDIDPPVVSFSMPDTSAVLTVPVTSLTATDSTSVIIGYQITSTPIPPSPWTAAWTATAPTTYTFSGPGVWDCYAWAMDAHGNVSRYGDGVQTVEVQCVTKTVSSGGGDYTKIADAMDWAHVNGPGSIIQINAADNPWQSWRAAVAGVCSGLTTTNYDQVIGNVDVSGITIRGINGVALVEWLCHNALVAAEDWGTPGRNGSFIVMGAGHANLRLENLEIAGAGYGGAGLRVEPDTSGLLLIKNCIFRDNSYGGLHTGDTDNLNVHIIGSQFYHNARTYSNNGQIHNIYSGNTGNFIFLNSVSRECYNGQLLKSRGRKNYVLYSRLTDEGDYGDGLCADMNACSNQQIDLPYGGESYVIGNIIEKSAKGLNGKLISYNYEQCFRVFYSLGNLGHVVAENLFATADGCTGTDATVASIAGGVTGNCLEVTRTGGTIQSASFTITGLTIGNTYYYKYWAKSGTSGNESFSATIEGAALPVGNSTATWQKRSGYYTATKTTANVSFFKRTATPGTMLFDDFQIYNAITGGLVNGSVIQNTRTGSTWKVFENITSADYGFTGSIETGDKTGLLSFDQDHSGVSFFDTPPMHTDIINGDVLSYGGATVTVTALPDTSLLHLTWSFGNADQAKNGLYVINNTFVNSFATGTYGAFVIEGYGDTAFITAKNNIFIDTSGSDRFPLQLYPTGTPTVTETNSKWLTADPGFVNMAAFDYRLNAVSAAAIGTGSAPGESSTGLDLNAIYQYGHPASKTIRTVRSSPYIGAYDYAGVIAIPPGFGYGGGGGRGVGGGSGRFLVE